MWCRLLSGEATSAARPLSWDNGGQAGPATARPLFSSADSYDGFSREALPPPGAEQIASEAYQRGLRDGEAAALENMSRKMHDSLRQMELSIEQLALHRARIQREAEPELVKLALAIARRILRRELTVDPEALLGLLKAGLEKIDASETHRVRVHPEHAAVLARLLSGAARAVDVIPDPALSVGSVVFETSRGALDAGLETQLREIERGFADIYPR
jgi:flagellar assembly protein FliH